jgi:ubiquinone/menaquinone biosynthesis C-methylase UbiE
MVECRHPTEFVAREEIFVWFTLDYVSYSFRSSVVFAHKRSVYFTAPKQIHFSERRGKRREKPSVPKMLRLPLPWFSDGRFQQWPIIDESFGGLSFRADAETTVLLPGTPLPGAAVWTAHREQETETLQDAEVKHITLNEEEGKAPWLKIGVSHGVQRASATVSESSVGQGPPQGPVDRAVHWLKGHWLKTAYLYHRWRGRTDSESRDHLRVSFANRQGKQVVGLLDLAFPPEQRTRAPLIIVTPGYGGRKETMSGLAATLVHNFRRHHRQVAVLRIDNTNNLGESEKDPGCEKHGCHNLHYTLSGGVADLLGALDWADDNRHFTATDVIAISISLSSVSVRRALTLPAAERVSLWIAFMGVADAQDAALHASGNIDMYGNYLRGVKNGVISLLGCLVDGDHYCADLEKHGLATLEDARRDMQRIQTDVRWIVGKHDGWLNPQRVYDIMNVKAAGKRHVVEVDAGHVPRSSGEALAEFAMMTRWIWRHLHGEDLETAIPSEGWLAHRAHQEWQRVRSAQPFDKRGYWKRYLLGEQGLGFDIVELSPAYRRFVAEQVALLSPTGKRILELGSGTGNVSGEIWRLQPQQLCCIDLVAEALARLREKIATVKPNPTDGAETTTGAAGATLTTRAADLDGGPRTAMRRWLAGELTGVLDLAGRIPTVGYAQLQALHQHYTPLLHSFLRGADLDVETVRKDAGLDRALTGVLGDLNLLAQVENRTLSVAEAASRLHRLAPDVLSDCSGILAENECYDGVMASLFLSYLRFPADILSEIHRVLVPGGVLVISSMIPDADISKLVLNLIDELARTPEEQLPLGYDRDTLLKMGRNYISAAANLVRFEEQGVFRFYTATQLLQMVQHAGFVGGETRESFGDPAQAIIVKCHKP